MIMKIKQTRSKKGNKIEINGSISERLRAIDEIDHQLKCMRFGYW